MLILIPIVFLLVAAVAILILNWLRPNYGLTWFISVGVSLVVWMGLIYLRIRLIQSIQLAKWLPVDLFSTSPSLILDRYSWPYAMGISTLLLVTILTAAARSRFQLSPVAWAGSVGMTGIGLLAVCAGNPLTLVMTWVAIDLIELLLVLNTARDDQMTRRAVVAFAARLVSIYVILAAVMVSRSQGSILNLTTVDPKAGIFLIVGAGLRLGVLPLHLPFSADLPMRRGLGTMLRSISSVSGLVLLSRLQGAIIPAEWAPFLITLSAIATLYASVMWMLAADDLAGRPYWVIGMAGLAILCVFQGAATGSIAWGLMMLLGGGMSFLFTARTKPLFALPVLTLVLMTGLPFTPTANGFEGLFSGSFAAWKIMAILAIVFLGLGFWRYVTHKGDPLAGMERWVQVTYPLGLFLLPIIQITLGFFGWPGSRTIGIWWASTLVIVLLGTSIVYFELVIRKSGVEIQERRQWVNIFQRPARFLAAFFSLDWLYRLVGYTFDTVGGFLGRLAFVLEGDGGVLWTLLLLALLLSLLQKGIGG